MNIDDLGGDFDFYAWYGLIVFGIIRLTLERLWERSWFKAASLVLDELREPLETWDFVSCLRTDWTARYT